MKRAGLTFIFLCAGLGVFAQSGVILEASGVVEIKSPGDENFVAAKTGDQFEQDTTISTGFRSFATIEIGSALISLKPLTRLTLTGAEASFDTETLEMDLQTGRVRVDIIPPEETEVFMSVMSSMAVISAGGTGFEFDTRNLYVDDGVVGFKGKRGQLIQVGAGANSRVKANAGALSPLEMRAKRLFPPTPAGTNVIGGSLRLGIPFTIDLVFFHE